ncbi:MAG: hypothetical protein LBS43_01800 [Prevotellaceae bacterium]|jgi:hypothetical protein|nr:hypothetical protein [Prevotellaceae bacterium]
MKKIFILFVLALTLVACKKDDDFVPELKVDPTSLSFLHSGETKSFTITSNTDWIIEKDADWVTKTSGNSSADAEWITVSKILGNSNATVEVTVAENTAATPRTAVITVKADGLPDVEIEVTQSKALETVGLFILSEGAWGTGTSDIAYYNVKTGETTKNYYTQKNGKPLGNGANDLAIYGSKLYCTVTDAGYVDVINSETGESITRIIVDSPRRVIFHDNKAYVTTYSQSVVRIDTASLEIDGTADLSGNNAEGICFYNDNLYVCNSGWGAGNTISVVDINSFEETESIDVPQNPMMIEATPSGEIYFTTASVYDENWTVTAPTNLHVLDPEQKTVTTLDIRASKIALAKDFIYVVDYDYVLNYINKINLQTKAVENISDIVHEFFMVYGVSVNPLNGDFYLTNQGQDVVAFDTNVEEKFDLKTGVPFGAAVVPIIK